MDNKRSIAKILVPAFIALVAFLGYLFSFENRDGLLTIAFLDVGQGDAIYIQAPNGNDIIIDGGPGKKLGSALREVTPFYKRSVGSIMITNPDTDHYSGFIDLLDRYEVGNVFESGKIAKTATYKTLQKKIEDNQIKKNLARRGMKIILDPQKPEDQDDDVVIEILYPDRDVNEISSNDGSVVAKLTFGKTSVLLQGDATGRVEKHLLLLTGSSTTSSLKSDIIKIGHHGSKTSSVPLYLEKVNPMYAVISAGEDNKYGHPAPETLATLEKLKIKTLTTLEQGTIIFKSDGEKIWLID